MKGRPMKLLELFFFFYLQPEDIKAKQERQKQRQEAFNKVKEILKPKDMDV